MFVYRVVNTPGKNYPPESRGLGKIIGGIKLEYYTIISNFNASNFVIFLKLTDTGMVLCIFLDLDRFLLDFWIINKFCKKNH